MPGRFVSAEVVLRRFETRVRRLPALALGYGERGPPGYHCSKLLPQVARTWKRGATATRRRTARRQGMVVLAATLVALYVAPVSLAHSDLTSTTPAQNSAVAVSPIQVTLRFNEPVESEFASVRVLDETGDQVDDGRTVRPEPTRLEVGIAGTLPDGRYTVQWRAVSADNDPISGTFVFHISRRERTVATKFPPPELNPAPSPGRSRPSGSSASL